MSDSTALIPAVVVTGTALLASKALTRVLPPSAATRALTALCVTALVATTAVAASMIAVSVAQLHGVAERLRWCTDALRVHTDRPTTFGIVAALGVAGGIMRLHRAWSSQRALEPLPGNKPIQIVDAPQPIAYSIPGRDGAAGQIIVSSGMLDVLSVEEQSALIAHEQAHLRLGHHRYARFAENAAATIFFLRPVANAIRYNIERWADEDAAQVIGDRVLVAKSVASAALATSAIPPSTLGISGSDVVGRVAAMTEPPRSRSGFGNLVVSVFGSVSLVALLGSVLQIHHALAGVVRLCR